MRRDYGGEIRIPISSIVVTNDLPADQKLELAHHLQSADFFNLALHPHAVYIVKSAKKTAAVDSGGNNYLVKGNLQLLGKSLPLDIPAKVAISARYRKHFRAKGCPWQHQKEMDDAAVQPQAVYFTFPPSGKLKKKSRYERQSSS